MRTAVLVGVLAFLAYWSNLQAPLSGDATSHLYLANSFIVDGDADLTEFADAPQPFVFNFVRAPGGLYSPYLPGNALLFVPFELLALVSGVPPESLAHVAVLAKLAASAAVALSVGIVFLTLRRITTERAALFLTFAYAFGSAAFATASQRYWQHGPTLALVAGVLYLIVRGADSSAGGARSGLLVGLAVIVRPMTGFFGLAVLLFLAHRRRAAVPRFVLWGLAPAAFLAIYDARVFGSVFNSPFTVGTDPNLFRDPLDGVLGLILSPSRGLLVYTPFILVSFAALVASWRWSDGDALWLVRYCSIAVVVTIVFFGAYTDWIGGWGYGNRYLNDLLPVYVLAIAVAWRRWFVRTWSRRGLALLVGWGLLLQAAGAGVYYFYWNDRHWDATPDIATTPERVWSWTAAQWQWVLARVVLDPPPTLFFEAAVLAGCAVAYVMVARRCA